jgi:hypothetical protein
MLIMIWQYQTYESSQLSEGWTTVMEQRINDFYIGCQFQCGACPH